MKMGLDGDVALVTGAGGNIGLTVCKALHDQGVKVIATDVAGGMGGVEYDWRTLDVTQELEWRAVIDGVRADYGRLDILINNAGIAPMSKLEDMALEDWRRCQTINVDGMFLGIKTATPLLRQSGAKRRGGAVIINVASAAADRPSAYSSAYCTSKAAVRMLTRAAAVEFGALSYPIRVNSLHPASVDSEMMDDILSRYSEITGGTSADDLRKAVVNEHPMGRFVKPAEVADALLFLVSGAARYVHGDALHVDGGYATA